MPRLNGCHNRPADALPYLGQDGYFPACTDSFGNIGRSARYVRIENVMTQDCQYSKHTDDPGCAGCQWKHTTQQQQETP